jgi:hypothetical protein
MRNENRPIRGAVCRAFVAALVVLAAAAAGRTGPAQAGPQSRLSRNDFLSRAESGVAAAKTYWWNSDLGWYDERLSKSWNPRMPLVRL